MRTGELCVGTKAKYFDLLPRTDFFRARFAQFSLTTEGVFGRPVPEGYPDLKMGASELSPGTTASGTTISMPCWRMMTSVSGLPGFMDCSGWPGANWNRRFPGPFELWMANCLRPRM